MTDYARALQLLRPGAQWSVGDTYDSLQWLDAGDPPTRAELDAVVIPPRAPSWPTPEFWARFTAQERTAIVTSADPMLALLRYTFSLHPTVEADNADLLAGLGYLVAVGILTAERKAALLTP